MARRRRGSSGGRARKAPVAQGRPRRPELFFGLVRPTGCRADETAAALAAELSRVGYKLEPTIKVSKLFHSFEEFASLRKKMFEDQRITQHMDAGDELRRRFDDNGGLAYLMAEEIAARRPAKDVRRAWLIDSFKHPDEIDMLRDLYGNNLIVISLYADESIRRRKLASLIAKSRGTSVDADNLAHAILVRDQQGADSSTDGFGQDVRRAFARADYFMSTSKDLREQVARLIETLFGRPTRSPSREEYGMAAAHSAALRSADLSRQVGAVIVDADGEVLVAGCNEVPKPGGGVYWEGDPHDSRDFVYECDPNEETSREMLVELFDRLRKQEWLSEKMEALESADLARMALESRILERTRVTSLVEFGRIVHAELNAVLRAAASGIRIQGTRMICTTFPCHVCARHLLGAGLTEVVYIEPYPKSLAPEQYPNTIIVSEQASDGVLQCRPFIGWHPARYNRIFRFGKRKGQFGELSPWDGAEEFPKTGRESDLHRGAEADISNRVNALLRLSGMRRVASGRRSKSHR